MTAQILIVDDDKNLARVLAFMLEEEGYSATTANRPAEALSLTLEGDYQVAIVDYDMPEMNGLELLGEIKKLRPRTVVILITAYGTIEIAVEAMKRGAYDFITKPFNKEELKITIRNALEYYALREENFQLRADMRERHDFDNLIGKSVAMQKVRELGRKVASTNAPVLIIGETGTGKELLARAIHFSSPRSEKPFISVNCGAIPRELTESELFGHRKGAFTGAIRNKIGRFELAHLGTLFLDEISEMPPDVQVKLLRVLQEKIVEPVGSETGTQVDVRIIAATNRDLKTETEEGRFRDDLYFRLSTFPIHIPPLRKRREDVTLLIQHFLKRNFASPPPVSTKALQFLSGYSFPGNVRELENLIERAVILSGGTEILTVHLPESISARKTAAEIFELPDSGIILDELEKHLIESALKKTSGNQSRAAELLGITRHTLLYRMNKYGIKA
ncbi:MAG: sigma-54 dependent transcriptional regulator [bacterium]